MLADFENGKRHRQQLLPAMQVPIDHVVPSVLHIFLGLGSALYTQLEKLAKQIDEKLKIKADEVEIDLTSSELEKILGQVSLYAKMESLLKKAGVEKTTFFQKFNGKH